MAADDTARAAGYMSAVLADARRAQAEIPDAITASVALWWGWVARLATWAEHDPTDDAG